MSSNMKSESSPAPPKPERSFFQALLAGAVAGFSTDVSLYPLDTIKTRLQSPQGFIKAGGFRGVYAGLSAAAVGSAPGSALFFSTYETCKKTLPTLAPTLPDAVVHMLSASIGEVMACLVRVPTEVIKQRYQANVLGNARSLPQNLSHVLDKDGIGGFYKGFGITIMREIPFAFIQFPLYESMKVWMKSAISTNKRDLYSYEAALCGSISGGIAAALTTPLDVTKTRLMLGHDKEGIAYEGPVDTVRKMYAEAKQGAAKEQLSHYRGIYRVFFAGIEPRVMWISIGGFVFFGAYEQAMYLIS